jgi:hypothetical protein
MKKPIGILTAVLCALCFAHVHAQPGGRGGMMTGPTGPEWSASMAKLFGDNSAFSATVEHQSKGGAKDMSVMGKMMFDSGKARTEIDMNSITSQMNPRGLEQMKAAGISFEGVAQITRPDKKANYTIYPAMKAYTEDAMADPDAGKPDSDFKLEITELGKETMDGHPCIKNKYLVTNKDGKQHEFTVWNATDLKKFPVRVESTNDRGVTSIILFKDVKFDKPAGEVFDIPTGYERYNSMWDIMMKRMGGMRGGNRQ